MKATARQRVLDFVGRRPGASALQVGRALKLSPPTVRHHLRILRNDGRIVSAGASRAGSRGRPPESYWPSDRLLGDNLRLISDSLLRAWPRARGTPAPSDMIAALTDGLLRALGTARAGASPARQLTDLVEALNAAHYQARWEAGPDGPRMIFGHCPYAAIIEGHPELCQMDREALASYMGAEVTQMAKIDVRHHSVKQCVFALHRAGPQPVKQ